MNLILTSSQQEIVSQKNYATQKQKLSHLIIPNQKMVRIATLKLRKVIS